MKEFTVEFTPIKQPVIDAMIERMKSSDFRASEIAQIAYLEQKTLRQSTAMRAADRVIQWHRKNGMIGRARKWPYWTWIGKL